VDVLVVEICEKVQVALEHPLTCRSTLPVKPLIEDTVTV